GQLRGEAFVLKIRVERLKLESGDHPLVTESATRQRDEVRAELVSGALTQPVRDAIKRETGQSASLTQGGGGGHEELLERRSHLVGEFAEVLIGGGYRAPT